LLELCRNCWLCRIRFLIEQWQTSQVTIRVSIGLFIIVVCLKLGHPSEVEEQTLPNWDFKDHVVKGAKKPKPLGGEGRFPFSHYCAASVLEALPQG
jgi:hypothetical protein